MASMDASAHTLLCVTALTLDPATQGHYPRMLLFSLEPPALGCPHALFILEH